MIEVLVKAKRAYYTKFNRIVDCELIKELHESSEQCGVSIKYWTHFAGLNTIIFSKRKEVFYYG